MKIESSSYKNNSLIAPKHAMKTIAGGQNISPHIRITDTPPGTVSLAISIIDRHPIANNWVHWLVLNIPPETASIAEGSSLSQMPSGAVELINTFGKKGYGGPQPPRGNGVHKYEMAVYALSDRFTAREMAVTEKEFIALIKNKVLAKDFITGLFENK